jgi:hypothetical protein
MQVTPFRHSLISISRSFVWQRKHRYLSCRRSCKMRCQLTWLFALLVIQVIVVTFLTNNALLPWRYGMIIASGRRCSLLSGCVQLWMFVPVFWSFRTWRSGPIGMWNIDTRRCLSHLIVKRQGRRNNAMARFVALAAILDA